MPKTTPITEKSDDELVEHMESLAEQKRALKAQENEARYVLEARQALAGLSDEARRIVTIHVGGSTGPSGGSAQEVTH